MAAVLQKDLDHLSFAALKRDRGWTDKAIRVFLGEPDKLAVNQHYKSGPPMRLYSIVRVNEVESSPEFTEWLKTSEKRKAGAAAAVSTKKESLLKYVHDLTINVPSLSPEELIRKACKHYNDRDYDNYALPSSNPDFLNRISVNYVRHKLSSYEHCLGKIYGKVGVTEGYRLLRAKISSAIEQAYPYLRDECQRQQRVKEEELRMREDWANK